MSGARPGKPENLTFHCLLLSLSQSLGLRKRSFSCSYCFLVSADGDRQRRSSGLVNSKEIEEFE